RGSRVGAWPVRGRTPAHADAREEPSAVPVALAVPVFLVGVVVSLTTSYLLVTRLERLGERLGLSEALLGVVAALAADAPEITSAGTGPGPHPGPDGSRGRPAPGARPPGALPRDAGPRPGPPGTPADRTALGRLASRRHLRRRTRTQRSYPPSPGAPPGRGHCRGCPAGGGGRECRDGTGGGGPRGALPRGGDRARRRRARRGDQPPERGRGRVPGHPGPRRRHAEHHAEQQHPQRHGRATAARRDHWPGGAVAAGHAHRRLERGTDDRRALVRLPGQRGAAGEWRPHHWCLPGLSRITARHGSFGGAVSGPDDRPGTDRCRRVHRRPAPPPRPLGPLVSLLARGATPGPPGTANFHDHGGFAALYGADPS